MSNVARRLSELGLTLPEPAAPVANYVPHRLTGPQTGAAGASRMLYTSGMIPTVAGQPLHTGKLGAEVSIEEGQECARQCVLNGLAWLSVALEGDYERLLAVVQLRAFVACSADFADHPKVANGASDLLVALFDDRGRHTRAAVGCPSLPLNVPVEIDFLFEVR